MDLTIVSASENEANMQMVADEWNLGPEKASEDPTANAEYWDKMARLWMVDTAQARRQLCANCEYFDDSTKMMEKMEAIPMTEFDMDGGGRGYCHKFDFICHNLRTCQAWEEKPSMRSYD
jgi:hypothetical protein